MTLYELQQKIPYSVVSPLIAMWDELSDGDISDLARIAYEAGRRSHNCGSCLFLVKDEGKPYYCAIKDLYTFCEADDIACKDWKEDVE